MNKSERDMQIQKVDTGSKLVLAFVRSVNDIVLFSFGWSHGKVRRNQTLNVLAPPVTHNAHSGDNERQTWYGFYLKQISQTLDA
jgi:hypothetical protein